MNFSVTRQNFHSCLTAVSTAIPSKTAVPVLSNVLLEASDGLVRMSATNLDIAVRAEVPASVNEEGTLTIPGKKLQEILRELPEEPVEVKTKGERVEMTCGRSRFKLYGLPAEEYPTLPTIDFTKGWQVSWKELNRLIHHTAFAVSREESRQILGAILWRLRDESMQMVATNGHRLARMGVAVDSSGGEVRDLLVPPEAFQHVQRIFGEEDVVRVSQDGNHLGFRAEKREVATKLINGTYPNYEEVIPKDNDKTAIVRREALEAAVRRMAAVASDRTHRIRIGLANDGASLSVRTPDLGEGYDEVELQYDGEAMETGFNANYLLEVLRHMPSDEVRVTFKHPERAATFEPVGDDEIDYLCLLMPLRLVD